MNKKKILRIALCLLVTACIYGCGTGSHHGYRESSSRNCDANSDYRATDSVHREHMAGLGKDEHSEDCHDAQLEATQARYQHSNHECHNSGEKDFGCLTTNEHEHGHTPPINEVATSGGAGSIWSKKEKAENYRSEDVIDESIADDPNAEELAIFEKLDNIRLGRVDTELDRHDASESSIDHNNTHNLGTDEDSRADYHHGED